MQATVTILRHTCALVTMGHLSEPKGLLCKTCNDEHLTALPAGFYLVDSPAAASVCSRQTFHGRLTHLYYADAVSPHVYQVSPTDHYPA